MGKTTRLYPWHKAAGAQFGPFAGYDMPIRYPAGAVEEHRLCRRSVGLFDIDHMGQALFAGKGAGEALSALVSARILDMRAGEARYALLLNEAGGIRDDLFIYRLEEGDPALGTDPWLVVVNAGNRDTDFAWFREKTAPPVSVTDLSDEICMIAVQGKRGVELLDSVSGGGDSPGGPVSRMPRSTVINARIDGIPVRIGRTGYTGEDGVELFYDAAYALKIWELLLERAKAEGIEAGPVGLAARDSLRFEAGMPLHGHEISPAISPPEALLSWACDFEKDFTGKAAVLERKKQLRWKLATINVTGGVPRAGYTVLNREGAEIGRCTSGMYCPTTETYSANVLLPPEYTLPGTGLSVLIRGQTKEALVVKRPLYIPVYRRSK